MVVVTGTSSIAIRLRLRGTGGDAAGCMTAARHSGQRLWG